MSSTLVSAAVIGRKEEMEGLETPVSGSERPGDIPVGPSFGPFSLADDTAYRAWRAAKLAAHPTDPAALFVDLADPLAPSPADLAAIADACARADMCIYRFVGGDPGEAYARRAVAALATACGLARFEKHRSAGPDGLVPIEVATDPHRSGFIPYSTRPIGWHTDGYYAYEGPERAIRAMVLHCVRAAGRGGVNALLDHEIAYIRLRDRDPAFVAALMRPNALSIPPSVEEDGTVRGEAVGPVFEIDPATGGLLMRYTARKRWITWADDPLTRAAVAALEEICADDPLIFRLRLEPGQGVVCNNVLHDRSAFGDDPGSTRLLLRLRSYDRLFHGAGLAGRAAP